MSKWFWMVAVALLLGGCNPEAPPQAPPVSPVKREADLNSPDLLPNATAPATAVPATGENPGFALGDDSFPTAPPGSSRTSPVDRKLTEALHYYLAAHNKLPQDFGALITAKILKEVPKPPPGKRFAIDRQNLQVVIID